jgi:hypothetical protein
MAPACQVRADHWKVLPGPESASGSQSVSVSTGIYSLNPVIRILIRISICDADCDPDSDADSGTSSRYPPFV